MAGSDRHGGSGAGIRTPSPQAPIGVLSGDNVRRCVLARELDGAGWLLIVASSCFGLDVMAVAETLGADHGGTQRGRGGAAGCWPER